MVHTASVMAKRPFERTVGANSIAPKPRQMFRAASVRCVLMRVWCSTPGKIISIETSALRATGRPGWEDLVRKCIYAFFQPQGKEPSLAKKLLHEGESAPDWVLVGNDPNHSHTNCCPVRHGSLGILSPTFITGLRRGNLTPLASGESWRKQRLLF